MISIELRVELEDKYFSMNKYAWTFDYWFNKNIHYVNRYDIDLEYMFPMEQKQCNQTDIPPYSVSFVPMSTDKKINSSRRHLLKRKHRRL